MKKILRFKRWVQNLLDLNHLEFLNMLTTLHRNALAEFGGFIPHLDYVVPKEKSGYLILEEVLARSIEGSSTGLLLRRNTARKCD